MLPKTSAYVKSYDGLTKWMYFLIEDDDLLKQIILLGIKPVLISKNNLIVKRLDAILTLCYKSSKFEVFIAIHSFLPTVVLLLSSLFESLRR